MTTSYSSPIPNPVRRFAREYFRSICRTGKGHDTLSYSGHWDTDADTIVVTTILAETYSVPIASNWLA